MVAAMRRASSRVSAGLASPAALFDAVLNRQQLFSERYVRIQRYFNLAKRVQKRWASATQTPRRGPVWPERLAALGAWPGHNLNSHRLASREAIIQCWCVEFPRYRGGNSILAHSFRISAIFLQQCAAHHGSA
jgi:hypothetical protein